MGAAARDAGYDSPLFPGSADETDMLTLEVVQGTNQGARFELENAPATVARTAASELQVSAGRDVSGPHRLPGESAQDLAQVFREDDQYLLRDLGAAPVSVLRRGAGGAVVELPVVDGAGRRELPLRDGDVIRFGDPREPHLLLRARLSEPEIEAPGATELLARRALADLPVVAAQVERDPALFRLLYEVSKKLGRRGLDLAAVFDTIAEAVFEMVPKATHVSIDLGDESDRRFATVFARARDGQAAGGEAIRASRTVVRRVLRERAGIWVADATVGLAGSSEQTHALQLGSILAVPLWDGETIRGVIQTDNRGARGTMTERNLDLLLVLAGQATLAIENARLVQQLRFKEEQLRGENRYLKNREERRRAVEIVGDSPTMQEIFRQIDKVKDTRATVCIEGETGTGKELIASAIHYQGNRRDKLFVAQNCAAMPENLLESELFGHRKGAFTGADHDKKGLFEIADGGTLFLDEIGEMSLGLQAKLLRALQEGRIRPVGATVEKPVDVRILCATNRSLEKEVEQGAFRRDLYYRLKVFPIRLPPLRERRDDVLGLVEHFLRKYTQEMKKPIAGVTPETLDQLQQYGWPGNIRELENEVQRLVIQADADAFITPELLSPQIRKVEELLGRVGPPARRGGPLKDRMEEIERWLLAEALREHGGNKTKTAETLGITREGLHKKLSKYGM
jgi:Nif-specific regulatory protein